MSIFESISAAFSGIIGNKMRSLLTMFGIIVGISSVIMISSVGQGVKASINSEFETIGMDTIELYVHSDDEPIELSDLLRNEDVEILKNYKDVLAISPVTYFSVSRGVEMLFRNETKDVNMMGVNQDYFKIQQSLKLLHGRYLLEQDIENELNTVVIDEMFARDVLGHSECIGQKLKVNVYGETQTFTVVGVLQSEEKDKMIAMYNRPGTIYIPGPVVQKFVYGSRINQLLIKLSDKNRIKEISENVIRLVELNHDNHNKYKTWSSSNFIGQFNTILSVFTIFLTFVAGISLFVGGIGVMNIMLVSVTERTREIGIRKSLGATGFNITCQFLIEAIVLTGIGGFVGMGFGYLSGSLLSMLATMAMNMQITPYVSIGTVLLVVLISTTIGIVFGVYPAMKAAKLDPIEALRFE